jgi:hypothetical protein
VAGRRPGSDQLFVKPGARLVAFGALCLLLARPASATVTWRGGFETGNLKEWSTFQHPEHIQIIDSPLRDGQYAARLEVHQTDTFGGKDVRVRMGVTKPSPFENAEVYYAFSTFVSAEQPLVPGYHQLAIWESVKAHPVMYFGASSGTVSFNMVVPIKVKWSGSLAPGRWHDTVVHVKWSPDPAIGFVEMMYDGQVVVPKTSGQTMWSTGEANTFSLGVLRDKAVVPVEVIFLDAVMVATELADTKPGTPLPDAGALPDATPPDATRPADAARAADLRAVPDAGVGASPAAPDAAATGVVPPAAEPPVEDTPPVTPHGHASTATGCSYGSRGPVGLPALLVLLAGLGFAGRSTRRCRDLGLRPRRQGTLNGRSVVPAGIAPNSLISIPLVVPIGTPATTVRARQGWVTKLGCV